MTERHLQKRGFQVDSSLRPSVEGTWFEEASMYVGLSWTEGSQYPKSRNRVRSLVRSEAANPLSFSLGAAQLNIC